MTLLENVLYDLSNLQSRNYQRLDALVDLQHEIGLRKEWSVLWRQTLDTKDELDRQINMHTSYESHPLIQS